MDAVLGIVEARSTLPSLIEQIATKKVERVIIGSHRKPQAMLVPFSEHGSSRPPQALLQVAIARADLIRRIAALSHIESVAIFGSAARGEERADSDVDLLVDATSDTSLFDLAQFEIDMELLFGRSVDVVDRASLDPARDGRMLAEAVPL